MYCSFCVVLCIVCVYMCTVPLPPGGYPIAVNQYIISYLTNAAVEKQISRLITHSHVCILSYPAGNAHKPYCSVTCDLSHTVVSPVTCRALLCFSISPHKRYIKKYKTKCVSTSTTFVCNLSHSKYNSARQYHKFISYSFQVLIKSSRHIFKKCSNTKFYQNPSIGSRAVTRGRSDIHTYLLTYLLTYSMEQSPSWEASSKLCS
jgi:hypothetical protein